MHSHIFEKYPKFERSNLIPILQDIQDVYGYLPEKSLKEISNHLCIPLSSVYGVATFYNQFRLTPLGKNIIRVCRGTACHVKNSANILIALENELGICAGQTTRDKLFTLETVACIGACSIAPVININDEYYGRVSIKEISKIISKYKKEESIKQEKEIQVSAE
ncbi:MAG: NADH-quinone oxidoreductase subunit NuoE [Melioribacter sp.]|jgi:NADH-quinone oxidoreductase E subunit|nr:NADH-quinone oxidoreductase subunit NuoE [Melioribacter sp.]